MSPTQPLSMSHRSRCIATDRLDPSRTLRSSPRSSATVAVTTTLPPSPWPAHPQQPPMLRGVQRLLWRIPQLTLRLRQQHPMTLSSRAICASSGCSLCTAGAAALCSCFSSSHSWSSATSGYESEPPSHAPLRGQKSCGRELSSRRIAPALKSSSWLARHRSCASRAHHAFFAGAAWLGARLSKVAGRLRGRLGHNKSKRTQNNPRFSRTKEPQATPKFSTRFLASSVPQVPQVPLTNLARHTQHRGLLSARDPAARPSEPESLLRAVCSGILSGRA
eukprot:Amastigsp_a5020_35.p1 type:complete len:277 gc:universal Amastigsp_a5020_35:232-1062(+)